jgi:hypothetical protein
MRATLTPRKQIEPLVIPDDIMNLPSLHGFVKFPDGFPAARIRIEWEHYPTVAEGFIARKPSKPDAPDAGVRGGNGKPQGGGDDVGRGQAPGLDEVAPANEANTFATNILSQPTEGEVNNSRDGTPIEATARSEPQVLLEDMRDRGGDDHRDERSPLTSVQTEQPQAQGNEAHKRGPTPMAERTEDLSIREAHDAFPDGPEDDGLSY